MTHQTEEKHFGQWMQRKERIHNSGRIRTIREGEVWWCAMGENVGSEINGKGGAFIRPVLILKKFSRLNFMGVPLTSKLHKGTWYAHFIFKDKNQTAVVSQARSMSVSRLYKKMGEVPETDLEKVRAAFLDLYSNGNA